MQDNEDHGKEMVLSALLSAVGATEDIKQGSYGIWFAVLKDDSG